MVFYALLNDENICIGIMQLTSEIQSHNIVSIPMYNRDYMWRKYENDEWSEEKFAPQIEE